MDPEGCTARLLSYQPRELVEQEFSKSVHGSESSRGQDPDPTSQFRKNISLSSEEGDEAELIRFHHRKPLMMSCTLQPPVTVLETSNNCCSDSSTIGSDDPMYYYDDNENDSSKTVVPDLSIVRRHNNGNDVFRGASDMITIVKTGSPVEQSYNSSAPVAIVSRGMSSDSSYDDETTLFLCDDINSDDSLSSSNEDDTFLSNENYRHIEKENADDIETKNEEIFGQSHDSRSRSATASLDHVYGKDLLTSIKLKSITVGLLVGVFIQFSTLGVNFLVNSFCIKLALENHDIEGNGGTTSIMTNSSPSFAMLTFNFVWSVFISFIGVCLMLTLRHLISRVDYNASNDNSSKHMMLLYIESFFGAGALIGVSLAWIATDGLLAISGHMLLSVMTLIGSLVWCNFLSMILRNRDKKQTHLDEEQILELAAENSLKEPFLPKSDCQLWKSSNQLTSKKLLRDVKLAGVILGFFIGFLIQFSSLGANFLLQQIYESSSTSNSSNSILLSFGHLVLLGDGESLNSNDVDYSGKIKERVIRINFVWSLLTCVLGSFILVLIRCMVSNVLTVSISKQKSCVSNFNRFQESLMLHLECFFAFGATLGLNTSWTCTDFLFGSDSHVVQNLVTLLGTLVWCKLVMHCCKYASRWVSRGNSMSSSNEKRKQKTDTGQKEVPTYIV